MGSVVSRTADGAGSGVEVTRDELAANFRSMQLIRRIEEEAARAYVQGKIGGFLHLYIGQEAIAVGVEAAVRKTDWIITTYRDHGFALTRGTTPGAVMAELYGKDTGCFEIDLEKWPAAVDGLAKRVFQIKARGDRKGAEALIAKHVDAKDEWASLREVNTARWLRAPKASFVYAPA